MGGVRLWSENFNELSLDIDREAHSEYWLKGGRGSGKSSFIARKLLLGMLAHPRASALVCRKVAATLRQSVYEEIAGAVDALGLRPWCTFRLSPLQIDFRIDRIPTCGGTVNSYAQKYQQALKMKSGQPATWA